jgi:hypothetical protein
LIHYLIERHQNISKLIEFHILLELNSKLPNHLHSLLKSRNIPTSHYNISNISESYLKTILCTLSQNDLVLFDLSKLNDFENKNMIIFLTQFCTENTTHPTVFITSDNLETVLFLISETYIIFQYKQTKNEILKFLGYETEWRNNISNWMNSEHNLFLVTKKQAQIIFHSVVNLTKIRNSLYFINKEKIVTIEYHHRYYIISKKF